MQSGRRLTWKIVNHRTVDIRVRGIGLVAHEAFIHEAAASTVGVAVRQEQAGGNSVRRRAGTDRCLQTTLSSCRKPTPIAFRSRLSCAVKQHCKIIDFENCTIERILRNHAS